MDCWEFHHARNGKRLEWYWRIVKRNGAIVRESARRFRTSVEAFRDAQDNGFDRMVHEWYLAKPATQPCVKVAGGSP